jgi:hypothetical protein
MGFIKDFLLGLLGIAGRLILVFLFIAGFFAIGIYNSPVDTPMFGIDSASVDVPFILSIFGIAFVVLAITAYLNRIRRKDRIKDGLY